MTEKTKTRVEIINEMRRLRDRCQETIAMSEGWNRANPRQAPIDVDPDGRLRRMIAAYDRVLREDPGHGPIAKPEGIWDGESNDVH